MYMFIDYITRTCIMCMWNIDFNFTITGKKLKLKISNFLLVTSTYSGLHANHKTKST